MKSRQTDYSPGGEGYRYAYNGMEHDPAVSGNGNSYTTEFRQYDPRLGRWKSLDPLMAQFPWMSPYVAFDDNPIFYVDPYGLSAGPGDDPEDSSGTVRIKGSGVRPKYKRPNGEPWIKGDVYIGTDESLWTYGGKGDNDLEGALLSEWNMVEMKAQEVQLPVMTVSGKSKYSYGMASSVEPLESNSNTLEFETNSGGASVCLCLHQQAWSQTTFFFDQNPANIFTQSGPARFQMRSEDDQLTPSVVSGKVFQSLNGQGTMSNVNPYDDIPSLLENMDMHAWEYFSDQGAGVSKAFITGTSQGINGTVKIEYWLFFVSAGPGFGLPIGATWTAESRGKMQPMLGGPTAADTGAMMLKTPDHEITKKLNTPEFGERLNEALWGK